MGLIDKTDLLDIINLHKIRNRFAHTSERIDFSDSEVRKACNKLSIAAGHEHIKESDCYKLYKNSRDKCFKSIQKSSRRQINKRRKKARKFTGKTIKESQQSNP